MYLPNNTDERMAWLDATMGRLRRSREQRLSRYATLRAWYLFGAQEWGARFNKIKPQVTAIASSLYAPRSARFAFTQGIVGQMPSPGRIGPASERLRGLWAASGADIVVAEQVVWSMVYGCGLMKLQWRDQGPTAIAVSPADFSVWRDDLEEIDQQQAVMHRFRVDVDAAQSWMVHGGMSEAKARMHAVALATASNDDMGSSTHVTVGAMNPITWDGPAPAGNVGGAQWADLQPTYSGNDEPTVEVEELWVKDDKTGKYRVIQVLGGQLILSDRESDYCDGATPFIPIITDPVAGYFWGQSLVNALIPLQALRERRMNQLDKLFARQAKPPIVMTGFGGVTDEKAAAMFRRGGVISSQVPGANINVLAPKPDELQFTEIGAIDAMFTEASGLTEALQGHSSAGIRSAKQAETVMGAGAGRLTLAMMQIERAVARGATLLFELARRDDATILEDDEGKPFLMRQMPSRLPVEVAAHSASPIFADRALAMAEVLMSHGIADAEMFIDIADPPMAQALKANLKRKTDQQNKMVQKAIAETPPKDRWQIFAAMFGKKH